MKPFQAEHFRLSLVEYNSSTTNYNYAIVGATQEEDCNNFNLVIIEKI